MAIGGSASRFGIMAASGVTGPYGHVGGGHWPFARFCAKVPRVNGREFITRVRRPARRSGIAVQCNMKRGKGSQGTLRGMCRQFGIDPNDL